VPAVNWKGGIYHEFCLVCHQCQGDLDAGVKDINGLPHCKNCGTLSLLSSNLPPLTSPGPKGPGSTTSSSFCGACGQTLSGSIVTALGSKWHKHCFVCSSCQAQLTSGFAMVNEQPFCPSCSQKAAEKAPSTSFPVGERKPGFTVDPRTGAKKFQ
jgi:hypothetical protein